jgi:dolichyl-phosphate beta-glucosyltransferase
MRRKVCTRPAMRTRTGLGEFFRGLRAVFARNRGDRVAEFEALAVGPETQRLDLANALQALLKRSSSRDKSFSSREFGYYRSSLTRSISIIIPAYNEEKRLPGALRQVVCYLQRGGWQFAEILVVDDGSTDGTVQVAEACGPSTRTCACCAIRATAARATPCGTACWSAAGSGRSSRMPTFPRPSKSWTTLWQATEKDGAQVAVGSRALDRRLIGVHQSWFRENAGRVFNLVMRLITGLPFHDTQCGFKLFEASAAREIFRRQLLDGFGFDVEVLFIGRRLGYREIEVPVRWNDVAGTKVSTWRGLLGFLDPWRVRCYHKTSRQCCDLKPPGSRMASAWWPPSQDFPPECRSLSTP